MYKPDVMHHGGLIGVVRGGQFISERGRVITKWQEGVGWLSHVILKTWRVPFSAVCVISTGIHTCRSLAYITCMDTLTPRCRWTDAQLPKTSARLIQAVFKTCCQTHACEVAAESWHQHGQWQQSNSSRTPLRDFINRCLSPLLRWDCRSSTSCSILLKARWCQES